ncbi:MAG: transketolase [Desulfomonile tiedjei]|nr:transketolase [Desulfomonile tiedjei]
MPESARKITVSSQAVTPRKIRQIIIEESKRANVGHIGSALSVADIIAVLFEHGLRLPGTDASDRDRFVLSKGHSALALYAALHLKGILQPDQVQTYCCDGSLLGVHPEHQLDGIDFSTGSLGHGLAFGAGVALASRLSGRPYRAFVLVSDAECNEGSLWETVMFAAHHKLANLVAIVDNNGQQALGKTKDVIDLHPLGEKWRAFGWKVHEIDGHNPAELRQTLAGLETADGPPNVLIANTISGKGVSFMEGKVEWHYLPLSDDLYAQALKELEASES